jgi:hypothetical protein
MRTFVKNAKLYEIHKTNQRTTTELPTFEHSQIELFGPENDAGKLSEMAGKVTVFNENVSHQRGILLNKN